MPNKKISGLPIAGPLTGLEKIPLVQSGNTSQSTINDILLLVGGQELYTTGGTYSNGTAIFTNNTGGTFNVSGFLTGGTSGPDTVITGGTYNNPTGTATFTNNTGGTFNVTGFNTGGTSGFDTKVTGGTANNAGSLYTFTNNSGGTFTVLGLTDVRVTGGTYSNGTAIFTNNTGGTFNVSGFSTSGGTGSTVDVLSTVTEIATWNKSGYTEIIVKDKLRGGNFLPYTGSYSADSGMVFSDGVGNKWKRQNTGNYINIDWYGCIQTNGANNDSYAKIISAIAAASSTEFLTTPVLFIPSCPNGYWYYSTGKFTINTKIKIFGQGNSLIRFNSNTGGFKFNYITSRGSKLEDFGISQYGNSNSTTIGSNFGFEFKDIVYCNNIAAVQFGDGFMLWNDSAALTGDTAYGNSNNSQFYNCHALQNWRHGFYLRGGDSNNSIFYSCDAITNGGCGVYDKSFLGNHYFGLHAASNGSPEATWQKGLVTYSGITYASITDDNLGNVPSGDTTNWYSLGTLWVSGYSSVLAWSAGTTYYTVGPWNLEGNNQYGSVTNCYMESDQAPPFIDQRVTSIGSNATYRSTSASLNANNGCLYSLSAIYSNNPGASTSARGVLSSGGTGVMYGANDCALINYDNTLKAASISVSQSGTRSNLWVGSSQNTGTLIGRSVANSASGCLGLSGPYFMTSTTSRTAYTKVDMALTPPPTTSLDYGDFFFLSSKAYFHNKPESIVSKYLEPTIAGTKKMYIIKGFQEDILSGVSGTHTIGIDYNVSADRGILYNIQFVGSNTTDDCVLHHEILWVNRGGVGSIVNNVAIRPDYVAGSFSGAAITLGVGSDDVTVQITGLPSGTNGKVNVKRIDY